MGFQRRGRDSNPRAACATNGFRDIPPAHWIWLARAILGDLGVAVGQCLGQSRAERARHPVTAGPDTRRQLNRPGRPPAADELYRGAGVDVTVARYGASPKAPRVAAMLVETHSTRNGSEPHVVSLEPHRPRQVPAASPPADHVRSRGDGAGWPRGRSGPGRP